jgi:hypothetical protein
MPLTPHELLKLYPPKVLARAARAERKKRERKGTDVKFDWEAFAGAHEFQRAVARDLRALVEQWFHLMCARQSGKTQICDGALLDNALVVPGSKNILLHLTGTAVWEANWESIWKPLCEKNGVPDSWHNETRMLTRFPNGSRVLFAGTDDMSNVRKFLGNSLPGGLVVVDESQDQADEMLRYICEQLLVPMMTATTRVVLAGVLPDVEAGYFYDHAMPVELSSHAGHEVKGVKHGGYLHYEWGRAANVHTPGAMALLEKYMAEKGLTVEDPQIARDWFIRRVWVKDALAYGYDRARNGYTPVRAAWEDELRAELEAAKVPVECLMAAVPHEGVDTFSFAVDPGGGDRFPIEVWGWGSRARRLQHVFDFCPPRNAGLSWNKVAMVLKYVARHYPTGWGFYDAGGSDVELDVFGRDTGIPVLAAARKTDTAGQIRRVKNLFAEGIAEVMIGSALETDLRKARRDPNAPPKGPWRWHPGWHPDPSEAARYALAPYFDMYEAPPPPPPPPDQQAIQQMQAEREELLMERGRRGDRDELSRYVRGNR